METLKEKYRSQIVPKLKEDMGVKNVMRVPKLVKIVVNMGIGIADKAVFSKHTDELGMITGQKPLIRKAKKSISNFKLRAGVPIGAKVTLRGDRMYEFFDRLINVTLPRIRDFRGLSRTAFDGKGNYTLGVKEIDIFPEIDPDAITESQGLDIVIVTTAGTDDEARALLASFGMPFAEK